MLCFVVKHSGSGSCNLWSLKKVVYLINEVLLTAMTADRHGELAALDLSITPSWLVRVSTVMPVWLYFSSFLFCSVFFFFFEHEIIYTTRVLAVFDFYCRTEACNLTGCENLQNSDSISFTLWGFSSLLTLQYGAWHVYKRCLVLLLLFVDLPLPDFHFQLKKNN